MASPELEDITWFAQADLSQYEGEYVAILDKKIVDHSKNAKELLERIKNNFKRLPAIAKVSKPGLVAYSLR